MKPILYVKGSTEKDVRISKFINFFKDISVSTFFVGWNREHNNKSNRDNVKYIFTGGGKNNKFLVLYYPIWMIKVFFYFITKKNLNSYNIIAVNFDTALPLYLASLFRKVEFIYEIYDQFALSYNFPNSIKKMLLKLDRIIMNKAKYIIHVDGNRVNSHYDKTIIIENTPSDFYSGKVRSYNNLKHKFAVTGLLNNIRGLDHILTFASKNSHIEFLLVGNIQDVDQMNFVNSLKNVSLYEFMPQNDLFRLMQDCCGIFSLYNPNLEINRLAASNKVYDAMMLGIPVITNKDVINSSFILEKNIGLVVNYEYDESWEKLKSIEFVSQARLIGENARVLYLEKFNFVSIVKDRLLNKLSN